MNEFELEPTEPSLPPLFRGEKAGEGVDPFTKAISASITGVDPGLVVYSIEPHRIRAAMVLAPEASLEDSMAMVFAASLGFGDALGALAPPEVGVHMDWPGTLRVNAAKCGRIHVAASDTPTDQEPDWLVVGLDVPVFPIADTVEPGEAPDSTTLTEEGCVDVSSMELLGSWTRHTLVWINRWLDEGIAPLHADWRSRAFSLGDEISVTLQGESFAGTFVGLDDKGGLLLRADDETKLIPLSKMLEMS